MKNILFPFAYILLVAFAPLVYTTARTVSATKLHDPTFLRTLTKDYLRTLPVCALVLLPVLLLPSAVAFYLTLLHLVFAPLLALEIGHIHLFRTRIGLNTFYSLFVSNMRETREFIGQNISKRQFLLFAALYLAPLPLLARAGEIAFDPIWCRWAAVAIAGLAALPLLVNFIHSPGDMKDGYVMNPFTNVLYHYLLFRRNYRELQRLIAEHTAPRFKGITSKLPPGTRQTYVIIIGESANARHFGCYGYARATTEFTDRLGNEMIRVAGVRSPFAQTIPSLEKVLTFADNDHAELVYSKGSIIDWFNDAGFRTYWFSNQYALDDTALTAMTSHAAITKCFNFSGMKRFEKAGLDGDMLQEVRRILANDDERKVIFLHLIGSHSAYVNRYPDEFHHFDGQAPGRNLPPEKLKFLNAYDDSIRYTDWFIAEVAKELKALGGVSYVLYFADHGEDIYDSTDARILGHGPLANEPMTSVPFMLWTSPELNRLRSDIRATTPKAGYGLIDTIHTIIDISSLTGPDYEPTKSIFTGRS